jgi:hypothetical protein
MKKSFLFLLIIIPISIFSQTTDSTKHEIQTNITSLITEDDTYFELTYEYFLKPQNTFGISTAFNTSGVNSSESFSLTVFYRKYFSTKIARGFFMESFLTYQDAKRRIKYENISAGYYAGLTIGYKFVIDNSFVIQPQLGLGIDILKYGKWHPALIGRGGIIIGFRF